MINIVDMNKFVDLMNSLTDMDWGWWPFLFLRPQKNEYMNTVVVMRISAFFGTFAGVGIGILQRGFSLSGIAEAIVFVTIFFFVVYRLTFAVFWNMRADDINGRERNEKNL